MYQVRPVDERPALEVEGAEASEASPVGRRVLMGIAVVVLSLVLLGGLALVVVHSRPSAPSEDTAVLSSGLGDVQPPLPPTPPKVPTVIRTVRRGRRVGLLRRIFPASQLGQVLVGVAAALLIVVALVMAYHKQLLADDIDGSENGTLPGPVPMPTPAPQWFSVSTWIGGAAILGSLLLLVATLAMGRRIVVKCSTSTSDHPGEHGISAPGHAPSCTDKLSGCWDGLSSSCTCAFPSGEPVMELPEYEEGEADDDRKAKAALHNMGIYHERISSMLPPRRRASLDPTNFRPSEGDTIHSLYRQFQEQGWSNFVIVKRVEVEHVREIATSISPRDWYQVALIKKLIARERYSLFGASVELIRSLPPPSEDHHH